MTIDTRSYAPTFRDRMRERRQNFMEWLLTDRTVGGGSVPNSWSSLKVEPKNTNWDGATRYSMRFVDDAFGIMAWKGYPDNEPDEDMICVNVRADVFRRMAAWYLWRWATGEWFGLRRYFYYKRLRRRMAKYHALTYDPRKATAAHNDQIARTGPLVAGEESTHE